MAHVELTWLPLLILRATWSGSFILSCCPSASLDCLVCVVLLSLSPREEILKCDNKPIKMFLRLNGKPGKGGRGASVAKFDRCLLRCADANGLLQVGANASQTPSFM